MDVQLPDGSILQGVPEGTTKSQIAAKLKANGRPVPAEWLQDAPAAPQVDPAVSIGRGAAPEPSMLDSVKQGAGNLVAGAVRGAGSIGASILYPVDKAMDLVDRARGISDSGLKGLITGEKRLTRNEQRRADMDAGLQSMGADPDSMLYKGGKLAGEIAGTAGAGGAVANVLGRSSAIAAAAPNVLRAISTSGMSGGAATGIANPLVRAIGGGISGAVSAGMVDPETAGTGAAVGAALPVALKVAGIAGRGIGKATKPNINNPELARKALDAGIPVGLADVSGNRGVSALRSFLNDVPIIGGIGERQGDAVQKGFNRAVGRTFGAEADSLTPEVLDAAKKRMGGEFDRLWNRNALQFDGDLFNQIQSLRANAVKLPQGEGARLSGWLDDIESKMVSGPNGEMFMPGDVANRMQSKLREQAAKATGFLKDDLQNLRGAVLGAFKRSVSPEDAAALSANMGQYKAMKTLEPLLNGAEAGVAGRSVGDVPAALLPNVVRQQYGSRIAESPFADLSQIGSQFVADRVARTGGGPRAMIQNSALGASLAGGAFVNPLITAAAAGGAAGAQQLLGSPRITALMLRQASGSPNALRALLANQQALQMGYRVAPVLAADQ